MEIKLVVGLGNPGEEYMNTYHNLGHLFVDYLKSDPKLRVYPNLQKTNVYMNESGRYIKAALKKYGLRPEEILVVHDDSDILLGNFKLSFGRGSAGHEGVESIIKSLKTNTFYRLRMGIRPPPKADLPAKAQRAKAGQLVLKKISPTDRRKLDKLFRTVTASLFGNKL